MVSILDDYVIVLRWVTQIICCIEEESFLIVDSSDISFYYKYEMCLSYKNFSRLIRAHFTTYLFWEHLQRSPFDRYKRNMTIMNVYVCQIIDLLLARKSWSRIVFVTRKFTAPTNQNEQV